MLPAAEGVVIGWLVWMTAAQAGKVALSCPEAGQVARYNVMSERTRTDGPEASPVSMGQVTSTHRLEVLSVEGPILRISDRTESGALLKAPSDPLMAQIMGALSSVDLPDVVLVVDTAKHTVDVEDLAPLMKLQQQVVDGMLVQMRRERGDLPGELETKLRAVLLDPALVEASATKPFSALASYSCVTLGPKPTKYAAYLPNVLGGPQLRAVGTAEATRKGVQITVSASERPDPEEVRAIAADVARRLVPADADPAEVDRAAASVTVEISNTLTLTATRGDAWPDRWEARKTSHVHTRAQVEVLKVERQPVE